VFDSLLPQRVLVSLSAVAILCVGCGDEEPAPPTPDTVDMDGGDVGGDTGADASVDTGPVQPPVEDLYIAYVRESTFEETPPQLVIVPSDCRPPNPDLCDPGICDPVIVAPRNPSEPLCNNGCLVTTDMSFVVFADPDEPRTLRYASLGEDFQLATDSEIIATEVRDYQVAGNIVAYRSNNQLHFRDLVTGDDTDVASFANDNGGFYLSVDGAKLFMNDVVSLTAMETDIIDTGSGSQEFLFKFISGEESGTGSFYSGREPMAISPDGSLLAVVTDARTSGVQCSTSAECTQQGSTCLTSGNPARCVVQELTLNIINIAESALLRTACSSDADCGSDHFCDLTAINSDSQGECLPGRFTLGPAGPVACSNLALGEYSHIRGGLAWRGDRTLIAVLGQDCITGNIDVTDLVALNLDGAAFERIIENQSQDHGQCYDAVETCFDVENCVVEIDDAVSSPSGGTIAFVADSISSSAKSELWIIDAYGRGGKELVTRSIDWDIHGVSLHPGN
jgi:hypothetical protein